VAASTNTTGGGSPGGGGGGPWACTGDEGGEGSASPGACCGAGSGCAGAGGGDSAGDLTAGGPDACSDVEAAASTGTALGCDCARSRPVARAVAGGKGKVPPWGLRRHKRLERDTSTAGWFDVEAAGSTASDPVCAETVAAGGISLGMPHASQSCSQIAATVEPERHCMGVGGRAEAFDRQLGSFKIRYKWPDVWQCSRALIKHTGTFRTNEWHKEQRRPATSVRVASSVMKHALKCF
jgi:hypothetical protein